MTIKGFGLFSNQQPQKQSKQYSEKRFYIKEGEVGDFVIVTKKVDDIVTRWEHSLWTPASTGNKTISGLKIACMSDGEPEPAKCKGCNAAIFNSAVKRNLIGIIWVIDLKVTPPDPQGRQWVHTRKQWAVKYEMAALLANKFAVPEIAGNIEGLCLKVYRNGRNSPGCGNAVDIIGRYSIPSAFLGSPRIQWIIEKYAKTGVSVTPEQAAASYFCVPPAEPPATSEKWYEFLSYANRLVGPDQQVPLGPVPGIGQNAAQVTGITSMAKTAQAQMMPPTMAPIQSFSAVPQMGAVPNTSYGQFQPQVQPVQPAPTQYMSQPQAIQGAQGTINTASLGNRPLAPLVEDDEEEEAPVIAPSDSGRFGFQQPERVSPPSSQMMTPPGQVPIIHPQSGAAVMQSTVQEFGLVTEVRGEAKPTATAAVAPVQSSEVAPSEDKKSRKPRQKVKVTPEDFDALTKN